MIDAAFPLVRPLLHRLDAERAHDLTIRALQALPIPSPAADDPCLAVEVLGRRFPNPVGLAAGFDKGARVPDALLGLGFGFVEVGGVVPRPQPGNPKPRVFRLPADRAVINRFGLNSEGLSVVAARLKAPVIEIHTGTWCDALAERNSRSDAEWLRVVEGAKLAHSLGLEVHAGHGLDYATAETIAALPQIMELNIGHFLMGEALFVGLAQAIGTMRAAMARGRAKAGPA